MKSIEPADESRMSKSCDAPVDKSNNVEQI